MKRLLKQTLGIMICLTLILGTVSTVFAVGDFEECCYCGETVLVDDLCDLKPRSKFAMQVLAVLLLYFVCDLRIDNLYGIFGLYFGGGSGG